MAKNKVFPNSLDPDPAKFQLGSGRNRIRIFFLIYYPAGTRSFFEFTIRPEPDPDLMRSGRIRIFKYFKFYVFSFKKKLIKFYYYNTIN